MTEKIETAADERTVEAWASEAASPAWLFAAAKAFYRWPTNKFLTRAAYDAALQLVASATHG